MKVVINCCYGGYGLSKKALEEYNRRTNNNVVGDWEISRTDATLISIIEDLKDLANGNHAKLEVVETPDEYDWHISEFDGYEEIIINVKEEVLRKLIRRGIEDEIVEYVMRTN